MRPTTRLLLPCLLLAGCTTHDDPMTAVPHPTPNLVDVDATVDPNLPAIDRDAAPILASGAYETATFALG